MSQIIVERRTKDKRKVEKGILPAGTVSFPGHYVACDVRQAATDGLSP